MSVTLGSYTTIRHVLGFFKMDKWRRHAYTLTEGSLCKVIVTLEIRVDYVSYQALPFIIWHKNCQWVVKEDYNSKKGDYRTQKIDSLLGKVLKQMVPKLKLLLTLSGCILKEISECWRM